MPSCSTAKNPRGHEVTFDEATHIYQSIIDGEEIRYISGTGFLHQFFPEFDPDGKIAERTAAKRGITVETLKAEWAAKGKASCQFGTRVHECCEDIELNRPLRNSPENPKEEKTFANAIDMAKKLRAKLDLLGVEKIVFSPELKIAGTIDLFARSRKDGTYLIIDHKTNKEIQTENKWSNFALAPIEHVPDLNFWHYALQLNLYSYLLRYEGYVPKGAKFRFFLNHVNEERAKLIELPDMQSEIKDMVIAHLLKTRT